jgi:hypothetical protein
MTSNTLANLPSSPRAAVWRVPTNPACNAEGWPCSQQLSSDLALAPQGGTWGAGAGD